MTRHRPYRPFPTCPHTNGVRSWSCPVITTEPCRPTACAGEQSHLTDYPPPFRHTPVCSWSRPTATVWRNLRQHPRRYETYTFSAKERDSETGLSYFGSRYYSSDLSIWLSVDPMSDKYPSLSPYVYCANNPVKLVDLDGEDVGDFYDHKGNYLGSDGKQDGKKYIVHNVGISNKMRKETIKFIKHNTRNSDKFTDDCNAYKQSSEIVGDSKARLRMCEIAEQDDGKGGLDPSRNREYGGKIENGTVVELPAGPVGDPTECNGVLEFRGDALFHSHASGSNEDLNLVEPGAQLRSDSRQSNWIQTPSKPDQNNAGNTTHYVFARRTGHVYLYNQSGTHVKMRHDTFKCLK